MTLNDLQNTLPPKLLEEASYLAHGLLDGISTELCDFLYDIGFCEYMPYGVAKARTGDPDEWIINKLKRIFDAIDNDGSNQML